MSRLVARRRAQASHYFWLPCPVCGQEFGGHQWLPGMDATIPDPEGGRVSGRAICPSCTRAGEGRRRWADEGLFFYGPPPPPARGLDWLREHRRLLRRIAAGLVAWWVLSFVVTYALLDAGVV